MGSYLLQVVVELLAINLLALPLAIEATNEFSGVWGHELDRKEAPTIIV